MQFTQEELRALQAFLQRVQLQGNEAMTLAILQQKVAGLIKPQETKIEEKPKEKVEENKK